VRAQHEEYPGGFQSNRSQIFAVFFGLKLPQKNDTFAIVLLRAFSSKPFSNTACFVCHSLFCLRSTA
jgi:hypothetical protein